MARALTYVLLPPSPLSSRFAFLSLRKRWALPGRYLGAGGLPGRTASGEHCGLTMQQ